MSQSCRAFVFRCTFDSAKFKLVFFFAYLLLFSIFFMNLIVKIYMKRHKRHNKRLCTTDFFNSAFCLVSCSSNKSSSVFHTEQSCDTDSLKFDTSAAREKKMHLGQVFQSVTSFETHNFSLLALEVRWCFLPIFVANCDCLHKNDHWFSGFLIHFSLTTIWSRAQANHKCLETYIFYRFGDECCPKCDFEKLTIVSIRRCQSVYNRDLLASLNSIVCLLSLGSSFR